MKIIEDGVGILAEGVTMIEEYTFRYDTSLTSIEIPSSVKMIGWDAFLNCTSLTSVAINGKIKKIDRGTFEGCSSIKVINVPAKKYDYYYERIPSPFNSLIVEMEPVKKVEE